MRNLNHTAINMLHSIVNAAVDG